MCFLFVAGGISHIRKSFTVAQSGEAADSGGAETPDEGTITSANDAVMEGPDDNTAVDATTEAAERAAEESTETSAADTS